MRPGAAYRSSETDLPIKLLVRSSSGREWMRFVCSAIAVFGGIIASVLIAASSAQAATASDLSKIKHIIIIMQENRSFDHYFGTYPGADGIPMENGKPKPCLPAGLFA